LHNGWIGHNTLSHVGSSCTRDLWRHRAADLLSAGDAPDCRAGAEAVLRATLRMSNPVASVDPGGSDCLPRIEADLEYMLRLTA
jgi:hypothetical protein